MLERHTGKMGQAVVLFPCRQRLVYVNAVSGCCLFIHAGCMSFQDELLYSVVPKEPDTSFFYLHPSSGLLMLARALDTDQQVEYRVMPLLMSSSTG